MEIVWTQPGSAFSAGVVTVITGFITIVNAIKPKAKTNGESATRKKQTAKGQ